MKPTEHEKQIARDAAKRIYSGSLPHGADPIDMITADILAVITAAKQQQNEDTARLETVGAALYCLPAHATNRKRRCGRRRTRWLDVANGRL